MDFDYSTSFNDGEYLNNARYINGRRYYRSHYLDKNEQHLIRELACSIGIDAYGEDYDKLIFNEHRITAYHGDFEDDDFISIVGEIYPDTHSTHPTDLLTIRAVLAHEWYGHRANKSTHLPPGHWMDEYRASLLASRDTPGLEEFERIQLMADAKTKALYAGFKVDPDTFMVLCQKEEQIWKLKKQIFREK